MEPPATIARAQVIGGVVVLLLLGLGVGLYCFCGRGRGRAPSFDKHVAASKAMATKQAAKGVQSQGWSTSAPAYADAVQSSSKMAQGVTKKTDNIYI